MTNIDIITKLSPEITTWRRHLHQNPELLFDVHETAAFVADKLRSFGVDDVVTGLGRTGVVGIINGKQGAGDTIGLRADMDALPLTEITGLDYASKIAGKMHACGHDGHTAMLLGAAQYLCQTRDFKGRVAVIFQPAEEGGGGGRVMVEDGLMERFDIQSVYGMHNLPGLPLGHFAIRPGPIMASTDEFTLVIKGRGGHAALPHQTIDPIVIGAQIVSNLQSIVSRSTNPLESVVVSVTKFNAGSAHNVIPEIATLAGTVRTLTPETRNAAEAQVEQIAKGVASAHGATIELRYNRNYPVTVNDAAEALFAGNVAEALMGKGRVERDVAPMMGGEDFSYMLEARPGAFIFIGNGESASLHHPKYNFNDDAIVHGVGYWTKLVDMKLGQNSMAN